MSAVALLSGQIGNNYKSPSSALRGAVTYYEDHARWNEQSNKEPIASKLYGTSSARKMRALETALEMAG